MPHAAEQMEWENTERLREVQGQGGRAAVLVAPHRIPDLKLNLLRVDVHHAGAKFHSDCEVMNWLETFVSKLQEKAALA